MRRVLRWDPYGEPSEDGMQFRLFYEGQFLASSGEPRDGQLDRRALHKHNLRRAFHRQLQHLWETHPFLSKAKIFGDMFDIQDQPLRPMVEVVRDMHPNCGFNWVPLVCRQFSLLCKLEILMLRRDRPGAIFRDSRDIDNRLKTLFDALKMPRDMGELGGMAPIEGEDPFFVLLQSDDLITHVSVETDDLLDPPSEAGMDDSWARVVVTVTLSPYAANMFNLNFA